MKIKKKKKRISLKKKKKRISFMAEFIITLSVVLFIALLMFVSLGIVSQLWPEKKMLPFGIIMMWLFIEFSALTIISIIYE